MSPSKSSAVRVPATPPPRVATGSVRVCCARPVARYPRLRAIADYYYCGWHHATIANAMPRLISTRALLALAGANVFESINDLGTDEPLRAALPVPPASPGALVFFALHDVPLAMGPTELTAGSHLFSEQELRRSTYTTGPTRPGSCWAPAGHLLGST